ncbi:uncharacterized protein LOC128092643 [Culex pipiens pallens]|uniref:uncharacterized protein LOC128092643 n=1 Tax=Culex pipiens pallens TaxID=42434 RepID=UPI0022AA2F51|nr:uncharacterized protein LOC128092643 [Culex pipiens pallens]
MVHFCRGPLKRITSVHWSELAPTPECFRATSTRILKGHKYRAGAGQSPSSSLRLRVQAVVLRQRRPSSQKGSGTYLGQQSVGRTSGYHRTFTLCSTIHSHYQTVLLLEQDIALL